MICRSLRLRLRVDGYLDVGRALVEGGRMIQYGPGSAKFPAPVSNFLAETPSCQELPIRPLEIHPTRPRQRSTR